MQGHTGTPQPVPTPGPTSSADTSCPLPLPADQLRPCPACASPLIPLRGQFRCSRCYFTFCVGCEDGPGVQPEG
jgi:hypothetical protein